MTKENKELFETQQQNQQQDPNSKQPLEAIYSSIYERKPNRNYKDTLFRFLFNDKEKLLGLYNALNHSNYTNAEELKINTLENAVYLNIKNDISFVFQFDLYLFEHQSTFCPNMPLRDLQYVSTILENHVKDYDLYSRTLVKIPSPHFVVFYNGTEKKEDRMVLKLSDAFQNKEKEPQLELLVTMININYGKNKELMEACKDLNDYSIFVAKIRSYMDGNGGNLECNVNNEAHEISEMQYNTENTTNNTSENKENTKNQNNKYKMTIEEAVERTIDDCIKDNILVDVLTKFRAEVKKLSIFEYNARLHEETLKKEGYEDGLERGIERGIKRIIQNALKKGHTPEQIADFNGIDLNEVIRIQKQLYLEDISMDDYLS